MGRRMDRGGGCASAHKGREAGGHQVAGLLPRTVSMSRVYTCMMTATTPAHF
jgi:hypothetical protein